MGHQALSRLVRELNPGGKIVFGAETSRANKCCMKHMFVVHEIDCWKKPGQLA